MNKEEIKSKLEKEKNILLEELRGIGKLNSETGEWEAIPEKEDVPESDQNDMADRFEDYEAKSSMIKVLGPRLNAILRAIKNLPKENFGRCQVCKKEIEADRLEANPAADTCKEHMGEEKVYFALYFN